MFESSAATIIACGMGVAVSGRIVTGVCWGQELGSEVVRS